MSRKSKCEKDDGHPLTEVTMTEKFVIPQAPTNSNYNNPPFQGINSISNTSTKIPTSAPEHPPSYFQHRNLPPTMTTATSSQIDENVSSTKSVRTIGNLEKSSVKHLVTVTEDGGLNFTLPEYFSYLFIIFTCIFLYILIPFYSPSSQNANPSITYDSSI